MAKKDTGIVNIHGKEYKTVALRVGEFRGTYTIDKGWGIETQIYQSDETYVVIRAVITDPEGRIIGTGYAEERRGSTNINRTSALENAETSAIGRALAACGFAGTEYASADEVAQAISQQRGSASAAAAETMKPTEKQRKYLWSLIKKQPPEKQQALIKQAEGADAITMSKMIEGLK